MGLVDLGAYLDDDTLDVEIGGKTYSIPSPDAITGLRLTALANLGAKVHAGADVTPEDLARLQMSDDDERDFLQQVLGAAFDQLVADGVSWVRIQRLGRYAFLHFAMSPEAATAAMEKSLQGEAAAPNRAARRAPSRRASSATAKPTRSRGSNAGTTSRSKPKKA